MPFADLLFNLYRSERDDVYDVDAVNRDTNNPGGVGLPRETTRRCTFDLAALRPHGGNPVAYGKALSEALFADKDLLQFFGNACTAAESLDCPLHFRLPLTSKRA